MARSASYFSDSCSSRDESKFVEGTKFDLCVRMRVVAINPDVQDKQQIYLVPSFNRMLGARNVRLAKNDQNS